MNRPIVQKQEFQRCMCDLEKINNRFSKKYKKAIILIGLTKAGKTTLLYYIGQKQLQAVCFQDNIVLEPIVQMDQAKVSHAPVSETMLPNMFYYQQGDCLIVDLPGYDDDKTWRRITNSYYIMNTISSFQQLHFIYVVNSNEFQYSKDFCANFTVFLNTFPQYAINQLKNCITLMITSFQDNISIKQFLKEYILTNSQISQKMKSVLNVIIDNNKIEVFKKPNQNEIIQNKKFIKELVVENKFWKLGEDIKKEFQVINQQDTLKLALEYLSIEFNQYNQLTKLLKLIMQEIIQVNNNIGNKKLKKFEFIKNAQQCLKTFRKYSFFDLKSNQKSESQSYFPFLKFCGAIHSQFKKLDNLELKNRVIFESTIKNLITQFSSITLEYLKNCLFTYTDQETKSNLKQSIICYQKINYIFQRKIIELNFLVQLLKTYPQLQNRRIKDLTLRSPLDNLNQVPKQHLNKLIQKVSFDYESTIFRYFQQLFQLIQILKQDQLTPQVLQIKINCLIRMGDLQKQDPQTRINYYIKALLCITQLRSKFKTTVKVQKSILQLESKLCLKTGNSLYNQQYYRQAISLFKIINNTSMLLKCVKKINFINNSQLLNLGMHFEKNEDLTNAAQMYQLGFQNSESVNEKKQFWNRKLKVIKRQVYSDPDRFKNIQEKIQKNQFINQSGKNYANIQLKIQDAFLERRMAKQQKTIFANKQSMLAYLKKILQEENIVQ